MLMGTERNNAQESDTRGTRILTNLSYHKKDYDGGKWRSQRKIRMGEVTRAAVMITEYRQSCERRVVKVVYLGSRIGESVVR
jgi:hypothetical protein